MSKPTGKLIEHWRQLGLPGYAQFNNDTVFQGPYAHPLRHDRTGQVCKNVLGNDSIYRPALKSARAATTKAIIGSVSSG